MKSFLTILIFIISAAVSHAQILLEDKTGEVIIRNQFRKDDNTSLIKVNTGDESIGFNYIKSSKLNDQNNYSIHEFGIKAKPTEGYASVISTGQFSPGIKINYALTKLRIFSQNTLSNYIDWGGFEVNYSINKYALYNSSADFQNQIYFKTVKPLAIQAFYNYLFTAGKFNSRLLLTGKIGYKKSNNYDQLQNIKIQDIKSITGSDGTVRQVVNDRTGRQGNFLEYEGYPITFAFTFLTRSDSDANLAKKLRIGFNGYWKTLATSANKPQTNIGTIIFLTKQDEKTGIRVPNFGINIDASDPFDVNGTGGDLTDRISVAFTSVFSL